jgi:hypothetical protein
MPYRRMPTLQRPAPQASGMVCALDRDRFIGAAGAKNRYRWNHTYRRPGKQLLEAAIYSAGCQVQRIVMCQGPGSCAL